MIADCSAAGGAESFVSQGADCSVVGGAEWSVVGGIEYFGDAFLVDFAYCHPSPLCALPHSCKLGNVVLMSIFLWPAWASPWHGGLLQLGVVLLF